ncbi:hypothetical protein [Campylobacter sp. CCUG 57310]|uniref:hypothetical protein n=1 Tax=Campylobacter sp. CCUG 57310 TaxID=2517362 RepID=UPI0015672361|nr:hypothetical protein [Campylobacter sp. CCUG 57310]QKF92083.1 hypothetical protein CORI_0882 [Campylobacter sp. CCUG 57310]
MNINLNLSGFNFYAPKGHQNLDKAKQLSSEILTSSNESSDEMIKKLKEILKELSKNENPYAKEMLKSLSIQSATINGKILQINSQILKIMQQKLS